MVGAGGIIAECHWRVFPHEYRTSIPDRPHYLLLLAAEELQVLGGYGVDSSYPLFPVLYQYYGAFLETPLEGSSVAGSVPPCLHEVVHGYGKLLRRCHQQGPCHWIMLR